MLNSKHKKKQKNKLDVRPTPYLPPCSVGALHTHPMHPHQLMAPGSMVHHCAPTSWCSSQDTEDAWKLIGRFPINGSITLYAAVMVPRTGLCLPPELPSNVKLATAPWRCTV